MKKQTISEEFRRMQKLAGIQLNEVNQTISVNELTPELKKKFEEEFSNYKITEKQSNSSIFIYSKEDTTFSGKWYRFIAGKEPEFRVKSQDNRDGQLLKRFSSTDNIDTIITFIKGKIKF